jgi:hypothetical protein
MHRHRAGGVAGDSVGSELLEREGTSGVILGAVIPVERALNHGARIGAGQVTGCAARDRARSMTLSRVP